MIGTWDPASAEIPRLLSAEQQRTRELTKEGFVVQSALMHIVLVELKP